MNIRPMDATVSLVVPTVMVLVLRAKLISCNL